MPMGLLDELRKQSTDLKKSNADEAARQQALLEHYQASIHPAMTSIYAHLNEVLEHLNFVKPTITTPYTLTASGEKRELTQHSYSIKTDSSEQMKQIILTLVCSNEDYIEFDVDNKKNIEKHIEYMQHYKLPFTSQQYRDDSHELASASFKLQCKVKVTILIEGDIENSCIHLKFNNFQDMGLLKRDVQAEQVNDDFLDDMGKYLVRESTDFMKLDLSSKDRKRLKQKVKQEEIRRKREMLEADRKHKEQQAQEAKNKSMFGFFDKNKNP